MQNAKLSFHTVPPAECIPMRVWIPGTLVALTPERKAGSLPMQCGSAGGWTDKHLPRAEETHMLCKCSSRLPTPDPCTDPTRNTAFVVSNNCFAGLGFLGLRSFCAASSLRPRRLLRPLRFVGALLV